MICQRQWYKAMWWIGLSYSASQSFTPFFAAILSVSFLWGKPLFPSPSTFQPNSLYLSMPGQREEKAILLELNFISLPAHTVFLWFFHGGNYNVILFHGCTQYSKARRWLLLLKFWLWLHLCTCISPEIASWLWSCVFSHAFKLNHNGSSTLGH